MLRRFCVPFFSGSAGAKVVPAQAPGAVHAICVWCRCIAGQAGCPAVNDATPRLGGYPLTQTHILYSLSPFFAPFLCSACVCFGSNIARRQKEISIRKSKRGFALGVIQCIHGRKNYIWWCIDCILLYSFRWKHIFCSFCSIHSYFVFFFLVSFDISDIIHLLSALIFIE